MFNNIFGTVKFNFGWETECCLWYNKNLCKITINAVSYSENDEINTEQMQAFLRFLREKEALVEQAESKITEFGDKANYIPALLLIKQNGDMGLIFDDKTDSESGIVITFAPDVSILSPDQYL